EHPVAVGGSGEGGSDGVEAVLLADHLDAEHAEEQGGEVDATGELGEVHRPALGRVALEPASDEHGDEHHDGTGEAEGHERRSDAAELDPNGPDQVLHRAYVPRDSWASAVTWGRTSSGEVVRGLRSWRVAPRRAAIS